MLNFNSPSKIQSSLLLKQKKKQLSEHNVKVQTLPNKRNLSVNSLEKAYLRKFVLKKSISMINLNFKRAHINKVEIKIISTSQKGKFRSSVTTFPAKKSIFTPKINQNNLKLNKLKTSFIFNSESFINFKKNNLDSNRSLKGGRKESNDKNSDLKISNLGEKLVVKKKEFQIKNIYKNNSQFNILSQKLKSKRAISWDKKKKLNTDRI